MGPPIERSEFIEPTARTKTPPRVRRRVVPLDRAEAATIESAHSLPSSIATPWSLRAVPIDATASHACVAGSYRSTELR